MLDRTSKHLRLSAKHRRALDLLGRSAEPCTEALLLAHGVTVTVMVDLVRARLATAHSTRRYAGREPIEVTLVRITDEGRRALSQSRREANQC